MTSEVSLFWTTMVRRRVCLFGTSADPPTGEGGHVEIAKALSKMKEFDQIRILPVYRHNFASKRNRLRKFEDRVAMCQLAFADIPRVTVSTDEKLCFDQIAKGKTEEELPAIRVGTADLLDMLLESEPETDFTFALGGDTFMDLTNWKWRRSRDVLRLLEGRFLVMFRPGLDITKKDLQERIDHLNSQESGNARLLEIPSLSSVSSTQIRISSNTEELEGLVTPSVLEYMKENKLYGFEQQQD